MAIRKTIIRQSVEDLLGNVGAQSAPIDLAKIANHLNLEIRTVPPSEPDISGCLIRKDGRGIIGINPDQSRNRQRFTIAHEIGHWLLHKGEDVHVDRTQAFQVNFRNSKSAVALYPDEIEANFFAAELLMPANLIAQDFEGFIDLSEEDDGALKGLADKYEVSVQALTYRLINLGLLPA